MMTRSALQMTIAGGMKPSGRGATERRPIAGVDHPPMAGMSAQSQPQSDPHAGMDHSRMPGMQPSGMSHDLPMSAPSPEPLSATAKPGPPAATLQPDPPMGSTGMSDMMHMGKPRNSLFMGGGEGPFGAIFMGGMFTILKIRENLRSYDEDIGWYDYPAGTVASPVGERQAVAPAGPIPLRPQPPLAGLSSRVTYNAVKATSCASMAMGRR